MVQKLSLFALCATAAASKVTPVQKVLQMMGEMVAKGEEAMETEHKLMAAYDEWVSDESTRLTQNMKTASSDIEKLTAFITKTDNDIAIYGSEIQELDALIQQKEGELAAATALREEENAAYQAQQTDLSESVDAIRTAVDTLKTQDFDRPQAMMMIQKMAASTPAMRPVLAAFLSESAESRVSGGPAVAAYESYSSSIITMLDGLLKKFEKELNDVEAAETSRMQNFDMNKIQLTDLISYSNKNRDEKTVSKTDLTSQSGKAKGDLAATEKSKAADEKTLADMASIHGQKTQVFASNQEVRKAELAALNKAIEIISSPNVAASYAGHINLAQKPSFLQTQSTSQRVAIKAKAAEMLRKRARALSSKMLATLAADVSANPFAKVIDMIKSLLSKLKEEAAAEADHKAWCDKELTENKHKRNKKTADSEKLQAEIANQVATIETQSKLVVKLLQEQDDLTSAMNEATMDRNKEKAVNVATIADAKAGAEAVKSALVVLRDFYMAQESGSGFIQQVPEMKAYSGMGSAKGGVVGMLEVIVSDFVRLDAETSSAEIQAQAEYDTFMRDAKADKEAKHKLVVKTKLEQDQTEFDKSNSIKMLKGVDEELAKSIAYFEQLKPECIEIKVSFEDRVAARKAEIKALEEAYGMLDQKTVE